MDQHLLPIYCDQCKVKVYKYAISECKKFALCFYCKRKTKLITIKYIPRFSSEEVDKPNIH